MHELLKTSRQDQSRKKYTKKRKIFNFLKLLVCCYFDKMNVFDKMNCKNHLTLVLICVDEFDMLLQGRLFGCIGWFVKHMEPCLDCHRK